MKRFILTGIVSIFILMSVLFSSCSDNNEDGSSNSPPPSYAFYTVQDTTGTDRLTLNYFNSSGNHGIVDTGNQCEEDRSYLKSGMCEIGNLVGAKLTSDSRLEDIYINGVFYFKDGNIYVASTTTGMKPKLVYSYSAEVSISSISFEDINLIKLSTNKGEILVNVNSSNTFIHPEDASLYEPEADASSFFDGSVLKGYLISSEGDYFKCDADLSNCEQMEDLGDISYDITTSGSYFYYVERQNGSGVVVAYNLVTGSKETLTYNGKPLSSGNYASGYMMSNDILLKINNNDTISYYLIDDTKVRLIKQIETNSLFDKSLFFLGVYNDKLIYQIDTDTRISYCMDSYLSPITDEECPQLIYQTTNLHEDDGTLFNDVIFVTPFSTYVNIAPDSTTTTTKYEFKFFGAGHEDKDAIASVSITRFEINGMIYGRFLVVTKDGKFYTVNENLQESVSSSLGIDNPEKVFPLLPSMGLRATSVFLIVNLHTDNSVDLYLYGYNGYSLTLLEKALNLNLNSDTIPFNPYLGGFFGF